MIGTRDRPVSALGTAEQARARPLALLGVGALLLAFLALYIRTAAPSVLSGDSAEFQMAAPLLGVPHPTTYPLYILLGKLATLLVPFGDLAWRVTLVSAICAACAVALFCLLAWRVAGSAPAAAVGALALGLAPGLWNAATMAEVYALLAALLAGFGYVLAGALQPAGVASVPDRAVWRRLRLAAFIGGVGFTHHGLFVIAGLPLLAGCVLWRLFQVARRGRLRASEWPATAGEALRQIALLALCFAAGLLPWLYPLVQYARYGPFAGGDYGLPRHYFWGEPASWAEALNLLTGGPMRQGIFRMPSFGGIADVLLMVGRRLWFEFGPLGVPLGLLGSLVLLRQSRAAWAGSAWVFFSTLAYLLLLGAAVQDAPVFTLPMLLPWALWIAAGVEWALRRIGQRDREIGRQAGKEIRRQAALRSLYPPISLSAHLPGKKRKYLILLATAALVAATLAWGYTRIHVSSKRQLWLFRRFGEATLAQLPPNAAVIAHWEQGMTLQYLVLAERQRPDVWVDVVEPGDASWSARAERYAGRPVFFVGTPADLSGLPVSLARADDYADLFVLRK
jgi:hypothetical protein